MKRLHLLRPGTFRDANGQDVTFSGADLAAIAAGYDPGVSEAPVVIGHPTHDAPAWGWIKSLEADGDGLYATPHQVAPQFAEAVSAGRYKKISVALYGPDHPNNPNPGAWSLRHVGFLGAQPPAVKGLQAVQFAEDDVPDLTAEIALAESAISAGALGAIARVFKRLREHLIDKHDIRTANAAIDEYEIADIEADAARLRKADSDATLNEQPPLKSAPGPQSNEEMTMPETDKSQAVALAERAAELERREAALAEGEAQLAQAVQRQAAQEASAFTEQLVQEGRVLPRDQGALASVLTLLPDGATVEFGEGDSGGVKPGPVRTFLRQFLTRLPAQVEYAEVSAAETSRPGAAKSIAPAGYGVDPSGAELHRRAVALSESQGIDYDEALDRLGRGEAA